jgi:protein TonB
MQNPSAIYAPHASRSSTRYAGIVFAALVNGIVIWAIINGLTFHPSPAPPQPTTIRIVKPDVQQPTPPMKQPPIKMVRPTMPATPVVLKPIIPIEQPRDQTQITVTTQPQPVTPQIPNSAASGIGDTHTTPAYPADARNLGQQGVVTLQISIDATGTVTNATVKSSSGYPELDQTAVNWVIAHWRYKPAIQSGVAVASTTLAAVKFDLKNAH